MNLELSYHHWCRGQFIPLPPTYCMVNHLDVKTKIHYEDMQVNSLRWTKNWEDMMVATFRFSSWSNYWYSNFLTLLKKTVTGSTENQKRIVDRGCCFGRVGPVSDQQRVVDQFLLIWSPKKHFFTARLFREKNIFLLSGFSGNCFF